MNDLSLDKLSDTICEVLSNGGEVRLRPKGCSMQTFIREDKDSVILSRPEMPVRKGYIYLYRRTDGSFILHRCIGFYKANPVFRGDNQRPKEKGIQAEQIIGQVSIVIRNGRPVSPRSLQYKFFWHFALPIYYLRKICRRCRCFFKNSIVLCKR